VKKSIIFFLIFSFMIFNACKLVQGVENTAQPPTEQSDSVGIANPASVYCHDQGYTLELRTQSDGGVYGVCMFPDGTECEEWAFFHQECSPGMYDTVPAPNAEQPSPSPTVEPVTQPAIPEGWQTFTNQRYGYQISYPPEAVVEWSGVMGVPTDEIPQGMTVDQYYAQLESTLSDNICVIIKYSLGYINILPNWKENVKYNPCGRTGVGAGEMVDKSEQITVNGQAYTAEGFEWLGGGDMLDQHNETMIVILDDGTRIEYGASPHSDASYQDYQTGTKNVLISIINTFLTTP
jgi:putative hemolysin